LRSGGGYEAFHVGELEWTEEDEPLSAGSIIGEAVFDISVALVRGVRTIRGRSCECERNKDGQAREPGTRAGDFAVTRVSRGSVRGRVGGLYGISLYMYGGYPYTSDTTRVFIKARLPIRRHGRYGSGIIYFLTVYSRLHLPTSTLVSNDTPILRYSSSFTYILWPILDTVSFRLIRVQDIWGGTGRDEDQEISQKSGKARESSFTNGF